MSFLMVWVMLGIFFVWAWSARPMLYRFGNFVAPSLIPSWEESLGDEADENGVAAAAEPTPSGNGMIVFPIQMTPAGTPSELVQDAEPTPTVIPTQQQESNPEVIDTSPRIQPGADYCPFCETYGVNVKYTHYWPLEGGINCWDYNEATNWCDSPTFSGIPWETAVGWGAACPYDWPIGTWVDVPYYGAVQCIDRGSMTCEYHQDGSVTCHVDILAPSIGEIDGQVLYSQVHIKW
jgi:hypothetical protein